LDLLFLRLLCRLSLGRGLPLPWSNARTGGRRGRSRSGGSRLSGAATLDGWLDNRLARDHLFMDDFVHTNHLDIDVSVGHDMLAAEAQHHKSAVIQMVTIYDHAGSKDDANSR
jgi:hypothetical protein